MQHGEVVGLLMLAKNGVERIWAGLGKVKANHDKGFWVLHDSKEWGGKGLEAVQCAPEQLLVVEACWDKVTQRSYVMCLFVCFFFFSEALYR